MATHTTANGQPSQDWFVTTHWTVVLSARDKDSPHSEAALETLCRTYWYPLYAYVRRQGHPIPDAQDLTQEFFARLLHKDYLRSVEQSKGKFRSFLLIALKRFLADEWDRARAQKRGGGQIPLSLDTALAESRYAEEPSLEWSAEKLYERRWALTLLDQTLARLRQEYLAQGKAKEFEHLKGFLTAEKGAISYSDVAIALAINEGAARVAVHRLRKRFRRVFREEIAHTVTQPEEIDEEVRYLMNLFGKG